MTDWAARDPQNRPGSRAQMSAKPLSPARIQRVYAALHAAMEAARRTGKIARNPCDGVVPAGTLMGPEQRSCVLGIGGALSQDKLVRPDVTACHPAARTPGKGQERSNQSSSAKAPA